MTTTTHATVKTPAHTPLPWKLGNGDIFAKGTSATDFDDIVICAIGQSGGHRSHEYAVAKAHKPEGRANAAFIVRACNSHYALLSVVQDMFENPQFQVAIGGNPIMVEALIARARAALTRAGWGK